MSIGAVICEFNPLHNGHIRLLKHASENADKVVCVMSGNFTQRGMPAVSDKFSRARHAVYAGANLAVELPLPFSVSSAENFAFGAMGAVNRLHADTLFFGAECGDRDTLIRCAEAVTKMENDEKVKEYLKKGLSYPAALASSLPEFNELLSKPNNLLAVEYIRNAMKSGQNIRFDVMKRGDNYNDCQLNGTIADAKAIRVNYSDPKVKEYAPNYSLDDADFSVENAYEKFAAQYMAITETDTLREIEGVSEGLENRFKLISDDCKELLNLVKTKRYTRLKLQRIILNTILDITKDVMSQAKNAVPKLAVLAVKTGEKELLKLIAEVNKQVTDNLPFSKITERADRLYEVLSKRKPYKGLQKI